MIGKTVYLGFGSNLGDRADSVHRAVKFLNDHSLIELETLSPLFESTPVGPQEQPMYLNAVGRFRTTLSCHELFRFAVSVEQRLGW